MTEIKKSTKIESPFSIEPLLIVCFAALAGIAMNECSRSKVRLDTDKARYQLLMDSINSHKPDSVKNAQTYIFNQNSVKTR